MTPLSLGRTLLRRLGGALLVPALLWSPLALLVEGRMAGAGVPFEVLLWVLSVPFALLFAGWLPVAERLSLEGGVLCVRWWSLGEKNEALPLSALTRLRVHGRSLHIQRRGLPALTLRVPWGSTEQVTAWITQVDQQLLPEQGSPGQGPLPDKLDSSVVAHTHEGVRLRLQPVHEPMPSAFVLLGLVGGWAAMMPLIVAMLTEPRAAELHFLSLVLLCGGLLASVLLARANLQQIRWVELALVGSQLKITTQRMLGFEHRTLPLADLRAVEEIEGELYLRTRQGRINLPMPPRSRGTLEALRTFLAGHIGQAEHLQGQVSPELDVLLQQGSRARSRERQRD
jgi:hypothetical protein